MVNMISNFLCSHLNIACSMAAEDNSTRSKTTDELCNDIEPIQVIPHAHLTAYTTTGNDSRDKILDAYPELTHYIPVFYENSVGDDLMPRNPHDINPYTWMMVFPNPYRRIQYFQHLIKVYDAYTMEGGKYTAISSPKTPVPITEYTIAADPKYYTYGAIFRIEGEKRCRVFLDIGDAIKNSNRFDLAFLDSEKMLKFGVKKNQQVSLLFDPDRKNQNEVVQEIKKDGQEAYLYRRLAELKANQEQQNSFPQPIWRTIKSLVAMLVNLLPKYLA